jgi:hypothetical protein
MLNDSDNKDSGTRLLFDCSDMIKISADIQIIPPREGDKSEAFDSEPGHPVFSEVDAFDSGTTGDTDNYDAENNENKGLNISSGNIETSRTQASLLRTSTVCIEPHIFPGKMNLRAT